MEKKIKTIVGNDDNLHINKQKQERARSLAWYALVVNPQHERQILEALTGVPDPFKRGGKAARKKITPLNPPVEAYVPIREEKHKWSDRTRIVPVVLISGIIFVRIRMSEDKLRILTMDENVKFFIYNKERREPEQIPDNQIDALRKAVGEAVDLSIQTPMPGDTVQIMSGPFEGFVGEVIRSDGGAKFQLKLTHDIAGVFSIDLNHIKVVPAGTVTEYPDERFV